VEVPSWFVAPSDDLVLPAAENPADSMVGNVRQRGIVTKEDKEGVSSSRKSPQRKRGESLQVEVGVGREPRLSMGSRNHVIASSSPSLSDILYFCFLRIGASMVSSWERQSRY
jgi:hypothetical protein